jgi:hypothetical protein
MTADQDLGKLIVFIIAVPVIIVIGFAMISLFYILSQKTFFIILGILFLISMCFLNDIRYGTSIKKAFVFVGIIVSFPGMIYLFFAIEKIYFFVLFFVYLYALSLGIIILFSSF